MPSPILASGERVFPTHPRVDRYFAGAAAEAARRRLLQCLLRGDGPALLVGAPGVGKSMLVEALASDLANSLRVVRLAGAQLCTRRALLQAILHGLGCAYQQREEGELRLALSDSLTAANGDAQPIALLVDEAQSLPTRLLEELRLLSNVAVKGSPQVRLVLAGSHALDEAFTAPELEAFSQRIAARCYLEPLSRDETAGYLRAHVAAAGGDPDGLLADDAYQAMWQATDGLPRLINQVGERAMVLAVEQGRARVDAAAIGAAWSDLHQLAAPWQAPTSTRLAAAASPRGGDDTSESSIEFGLLDDDDDFGGMLQAEAEAVSAAAREMHADAAAPRGVWDADKRLHLATSTPEHDADDDEEECVSYAFPSIAHEGRPERELDEEDTLVDEEDDDALAAEPVAEPLAPVADATAERVEDPACERRPAAAPNPFDEPFDEEEVVLDPFADLERVIPAAPRVAAQKPTELSQAYAALVQEDPEPQATTLAPETIAPVPMPLDERRASVERSPAGEPAVAAGLAVADADSCPTALLEEDGPIVTVEPDEPCDETESSACRQDYRQLFANLRHG